MDNNFINKLKHLYISPLRKCNLNCQMCYVKKNSETLLEQEIIDFVEKYIAKIDLKVITFCGGEVFLLPYFINLINYLTDKNIFIQIITNGTIGSIEKINNPNLVNLIVSVDGLEDYHNKNRGLGNFQKSMLFIKKAKKLGFHIEVFSILTKQNFDKRKDFENFINKELGKIEITYHPKKPIQYLQNHPIDNINLDNRNFDFLTELQMMEIYKTSKSVFPPKKFGCYQISLFSDKKIFGCCEGIKPIGNINDSIDFLIDNLKKRVFSNNYCIGCVEKDFMCGVSKYFYE